MGWRSKGQKWEAIRRTHIRRISPEDSCPHSGKSEVSCLCRTLSSNLQDEGSECVASAVDRLTGCTAYFNLSSLLRTCRPRQPRNLLRDLRGQLLQRCLTRPRRQPDASSGDTD